MLSCSRRTQRVVAFGSLLIIGICLFADLLQFWDPTQQGTRTRRAVNRSAKGEDELTFPSSLPQEIQHIFFEIPTEQQLSRMNSFLQANFGNDTFNPVMSASTFETVGIISNCPLESATDKLPPLTKKYVQSKLLYAKLHGHTYIHDTFDYMKHLNDWQSGLGISAT